MMSQHTKKQPEADVAQRMDQGRLSESWKWALAVFLIMRVFFSLWMVGVRQLYPGDVPQNLRSGPALDVVLVDNPWLEVWQRWDALQYQAIAEGGYGSFESALFTPPLYPWLMALLNQMTGLSTLISGLIISNAASFFALLYWIRLVRLETNDKTAKRSVVYIASFPTAFFLFAPYTESLYLLAGVLVFYNLRLEKYISAGCWVWVAATARLPGFLVLLPILVTLWTKWRSGGPGQVKLFLAVVIGSVGVLFYPTYVWLVLDLPPWTPFLVQVERYAGSVSFPGINILLALQQALAGYFVVSNLIDAFLVTIFTAGTVYVWKKFGPLYGVYCAGVMLLLLTRVSGLQPLLSVSRYVLAAFPVIMLFAVFGENERFNRVYLYSSWLLSLYLSAQFAIWGWAG